MKGSPVVFRLTDLVDGQVLQQIQDDLAKATGISTVILDPKGRPITRQSEPLNDFCQSVVKSTYQGKKRCELSDRDGMRAARRGLGSNDPCAPYRCRHDLWDFMVPVHTGNDVLAFLSGGQVLRDDEPLDDAALRDNARKLGVDPDEYMRSLSGIRRMSPEQMQAAANVWQTAALAISTLATQRLRALQENSRNWGSIDELARRLVQPQPLADVISAIGEEAVKLLEIDTMSVYLTEPLGGAPSLLFSRGLRYEARAACPITDSPLIRTILRRGKDTFIGDARTHGLMSRSPFVSREQIQSSAVLILRARDRIVGLMFANYRRPHQFDEEDKRMLRSFASIAAMAIAYARLQEQNERVFEQLTEQATKLKLLHAVTRTVQLSADLQQSMFLILTAVTIRGGLEFNRAIVFLRPGRDDALECRWAIGPVDGEEARTIYNSPQWSEATALPRRLSRAAELYRKSVGVFTDTPIMRAVEGRPVRRGDGETALFQVLDQGMPLLHRPGADETGGGPILSRFAANQFALVPLRGRQHSIGVLYVDRAITKQPIATEELDLLDLFAAEAAAAIEAQDDIEQLRRLADELRQARDTADAASRAKTEFLANVSHEIRTPMNPLLGQCQLLLRDPSLASEHREQVEMICRNGERLLGLINDVLELSRIESGRAEVTVEPFDFHVTLRDLEATFGPHARAKKLELRVLRDDDVPQWLLTDAVKVWRVIANLLVNAVKFTEVGSVELRVGASSDETGVKLTATVEDTGVGIGRDDLGQLFRPFGQARVGRSRHEGTGLGLAICKGLAGLLGGDVTVESQEGRGSTFCFTFHAGLAEPRTVRPGLGRSAVLHLAPDQGTRRILNVDDDDDNRRVLSRLLAAVGFEVMDAPDGPMALDLVREWSPHLVLLDITMPGMDGYEVMRRVRAGTAGLPPTIIAVTARALDEDRKAIAASGASGFLLKPYDHNEMLEEIGKHLGVRYIRSDGGALPGAPALLACAPGSRELLTSDLLDDLRKAVLEGYLDRFPTLLAGVKGEYPELVSALVDMARRFDYDSLRAFLCEEPSNELQR